VWRNKPSLKMARALADARGGRIVSVLVRLGSMSGLGSDGRQTWAETIISSMDASVAFLSPAHFSLACKQLSDIRRRLHPSPSPGYQRIRLRRPSPRSSRLRYRGPSNSLKCTVPLSSFTWACSEPASQFKHNMPFVNEVDGCDALDSSELYWWTAAPACLMSPQSEMQPTPNSLPQGTTPAKI
jgi:hypothetical protein